MENNSLFINLHLNYDEVIRRLKYWNEQGQAGIIPSKLLIELLERDKNMLYMEAM